MDTMFIMNLPVEFERALVHVANMKFTLPEVY